MNGEGRDNLNNSDITSVNIIGCCLSRGIFNSKRGKRYCVMGYVFNTNPFLINQKISEEYNISDEELIKLPSVEFQHKFPRDTMRSLINCNAEKRLLERKGDWIIIDTHYSAHDLFKFTFPNGEKIFLQSNYAYFTPKLIEVSNSLKGCVSKNMNAKVNMQYYLKEFCNFLRSNWGQNIILINAKQSLIQLQDGTMIDEMTSRRADNTVDNYATSKAILSELKCHYIEIPFMPIARDSVSVVHYLSVINDYLKLSVDAIVEHGNTNPSTLTHIINELNIKYGLEVGYILSGEMLPTPETYISINNLLSKGEYEKGWSLINRLISQGDKEIYGHMGRAYRDGKGVEKDQIKAAEWMRKAADKNVGWAKNELFDILWWTGTPESYAEMINIATNFADVGDGGAMLRVGRAYRDGKGVEKDQIKAAEWMRKSIEAGVGWAKNELFDVLWWTGTPESYAEMINIATDFADAGDGGAMLRLGRAYRDGKGVTQNLHLSAGWFRKAIEHNIIWVKNELFDVLWRIGTPESYSEMISVIAPHAEAGDGNAAGRLARAYRDGRGVCLDYNVATQWYIKAKNRGIPWAEKELNSMNFQRKI